jgi:amino acid permease
MILVEAAERYKTFDLGSLLGHLPGKLGPLMQWLCNGLVWMSGYMCLVSYFIIIADSLVPLSSAGGLLQNRHVVVCLIGAIVFPLSFLSQREMSWTSSAVVVVNIYIFGLLARLYEVDPKPADVCILGFSRGNIAMVSAMMQAIIIQMCVLPMYGQLEQRSPRKFLGVLITGFSCLFAIFSGFSVIAYLTFGPSVHGNVLVDLPHNVWGNLARFAASVSVLGVFPLIAMTMMAPVQAWARIHMPDRHSRDGVSTLATLTIISAVMVASYYIRDLGLMNVVNGAMCVGVIVAACPAMVGFFLVERENPRLWQLAMCALLVLGGVSSILGLIYTDNYVGLLKGSCLWTLQ